MLKFTSRKRRVHSEYTSFKQVVAFKVDFFFVKSNIKLENGNVIKLAMI